MGNKHHKSAEEASLQFRQSKDKSKSGSFSEPQKKGSYHLPVKGPELYESDYLFLTENTKKSRDDLRGIFGKYNLNKENPQLNRQDFINIYEELNPELKDQLNEFANQAYRVFDPENSGNLLLNEFLVTYALTSHDEMRRKLDYSFELNDADKSGSLTKDEVKSVLNCICDLLGAESKNKNTLELIEMAIRDVQFNADERVTKG